MCIIVDAKAACFGRGCAGVLLYAAFAVDGRFIIFVAESKRENMGGLARLIKICLPI